MDKPFIIPPSPFEAEKARLGRGFLKPIGKPVTGVSRSMAAAGERRDTSYHNRPKLTDDQRLYIGRTSGPRDGLAELFNISPETVSRLRKRYREGRLDA